MRLAVFNCCSLTVILCEPMPQASIKIAAAPNEAAAGNCFIGINYSLFQSIFDIRT